MFMSNDILDEDVEFAKNHLMQSNFDESFKKRLLKLLNSSKAATNGISLEEKV